LSVGRVIIARGAFGSYRHQRLDDQWCCRRAFKDKVSSPRPKRLELLQP
jgi:hypothetical protein